MNTKFKKKATIITLLLCSALTLGGCGSKTVIESNNGFNDNVKITEKLNENESTHDNSDAISNDIGTLTEKNIIGEMTAEYSWASDPSVQENLLKDGAFAAKIKAINTSDAIFLDKDYLLGPVTPIEVELVEVYGDVGTVEFDTIYNSGGAVSVSEIMKYVDSDTATKLEFDKIEESKKGSSYINYTSEYDYDLIPGGEYIVILNKSPENEQYHISCCGYGIFQKDVGMSGEENYINVITGKSFAFN